MTTTRNHAFISVGNIYYRFIGIEKKDESVYFLIIEE